VSGRAVVVHLLGESEPLVIALTKLTGQDFALIGGLAVSARLGTTHRATADVDSVFNTDVDGAGVVTDLISAGLAERSEANELTVDGVQLAPIVHEIG